jgi:hypothetical protein
VGEFGVLLRKVGLWAGGHALRATFQTFAHAGGFYGYHLPDMDQVADVAAPYYNNDLRGGEGHMEVGKLILNVAKSKANMTLSVKPFGCMPSSGVSDGVQSLITEKYPGTIFCAVETSGDGAVNFQSRVQMYLFKARQAAAAELEKALSDTGLTLSQVNDYLKQHSRLKHPLHKAPHRAGSTAADVVYEVGARIGKTSFDRAREAAAKLMIATARRTKTAMANAPDTARRSAALGVELQKELFDIAREKAPILARAALKRSRERLTGLRSFL